MDFYLHEENHLLTNIKKEGQLDLYEKTQLFKLFNNF